MDDDTRRKLLQRGINLVQPGPAAVKVPQIVYGLNHVTGQVEARSAMGRGAEFTFLGENSLPTPAPRTQNGSRDFRDGGASIERSTPPIPIDSLGEGVHFIK